LRKLTASKKYTVHSRGIWERFRRIFALDPNRSSGVPLNMQFRNPPPGGLPPYTYDDPVTVPAGDIADNPYWKRDNRRSYPQTSVVNQSQAVGLLTFGSEKKPVEGALGIGQEGETQLVKVEKEGEETGLAGLFQSQSEVAKVLGPDGLPPRPTELHFSDKTRSQDWQLNAEDDQAYPSQ
jgi:hypothetical protein